MVKEKDFFRQAQDDIFFSSRIDLHNGAEVSARLLSRTALGFGLSALASLKVEPR